MSELMQMKAQLSQMMNNLKQKDDIITQQNVKLSQFNNIGFQGQGQVQGQQINNNLGNTIPMNYHPINNDINSMNKGNQSNGFLTYSNPLPNNNNNFSQNFLGTPRI
jgi:hypothetical protein